ncbi:hypothetical protein GBA52_015930 [Prunus armeniaca]|nr:hypothetical protein GBA52_015930 [Prunus armeniaca]
MVKLAFGSFGDSFSVGSLKSYLAEFIATLLFVLELPLLTDEECRNGPLTCTSLQVQRAACQAKAYIARLRI